MKRFTLLIFSVLFLSSGMVRAQVNEFNISAANNSIIRSVRGDSVLVYAEESLGNGYFLLYRDGTPTAQAFQVSIDGIQVRDVQIYKDRTAYFCGTKTIGASNFAVVGQFDIIDAFTGTGKVLWTYFEQWMGYDGLSVTDLTRLDLFKCHDTVCMAMTGKALYGMGVSYPNITVASAWFDGMYWHLYAHTNRYTRMKFTDVACLDRMILAVGPSNDDTGCFVKPFRVTPDFPAHPVVTDEMWGLGYGSPVGEVLVDQMSHDSVVLAHFDNSSGASVVFHLLCLSSSGAPTAPIRTWKTSSIPAAAYGPGQKLKELNSVGDTAFLLHVNEYPTSGYASLSDWVLSLDYNNYTLSPAPIVYTPLKMWRPLYGAMHSMDAGVVPMRLSGQNNTWLEAYGPHSVWGNRCLYADSVGPLYETAWGYSRDIVDETFSDSVLTLSFMPKIFQVDVSAICNRISKEDEQ